MWEGEVVQESRIVKLVWELLMDRVVMWRARERYECDAPVSSENKKSVALDKHMIWYRSE